MHDWKEIIYKKLKLWEVGTKNKKMLMKRKT